MESYQLNIGHKKLSIIDYPGERGTIVAIHGLTGNKKSLGFIFDELSKKYRIISYDIRGRGDSSGADNDTSIHSHADDVIELIQRLKIKRPILLGYSMGAYIAAIVASKLKEIGALVLLDGAGNIAPEKRESVQPSINRLEKDYPTKQAYIDEVNNIYASLGVTLNSRIVENADYEITLEDGVWINKANAESVRSDFESFYSFEPSSVFSTISCKILLITAKGNLGTQPPLFDDTSYEELINTKDIQVYHSNCNHYTLVQEYQPIINEVIDNFLNSNNSV